MLTGNDIIVFSDDWGRHPCSCQHIISRFLPANRILWVNTLGMRNPSLTLYDLKRSIEKVSGWFAPKQPIVTNLTKNLTVIRPVVTPYNNFLLLRARNRRSVVRTVRNAMADLGMTNPVVITTLPNSVDYLGSFNEAASVYYCVDDFTQWPGLDHAFVGQMEEQLMAKVDLVCATADELCRKKTRNGKVPLLLPHGVDYEHFASATPDPDSIYPAIPRPIIGFFGAISPWLDFDLLYNLIHSRPEWSFVFIGPVDVDMSRLIAFSNFHYLGKIPYQELPKYAASFDVALIPFLVNELTISVNPLKLMEYLACGLPVVSTSLPEVAKYREVVYLADTAQEFAVNVERALVENSLVRQQLRHETARGRSWDSVADKFSAAIEEVITHKAGRSVR